MLEKPVATEPVFEKPVATEPMLKKPVWRFLKINGFLFERFLFVTSVPGLLYKCMKQT